MCGIVGYVGPKEPVPMLISGLERLEYRGYDSAGVATIDSGKFNVSRAEGKLSRLKQVLTDRGQLDAEKQAVDKLLRVGIGHTRWATHGRPSETNAHPHTAGDICLVHNGIVENYRELREMLEKQGRKFSSETDTEIAAHLVDLHLQQGGDLFDAVAKAMGELQGSYSLVVISLKNPDEIVVGKHATPLIVGLGKEENFVASDIPAILEHTRDVLVIEDGEVARIRQNEVTIHRDGEPIDREPLRVTWDPVTAEKGGYRHFMLKEIHEQPEVVTDTFRGRVNQQRNTVVLEELGLDKKQAASLGRVLAVACGTAWHAALVTRYYIEHLAKLPVEVDYASEFRYRSGLLDERALAFAISQSGETADTLGAIKYAKQQGASTLAICNVVGSSIARFCDHVIYTHAGPEISVASTKAFATQLTAGLLLALKLAELRGSIEQEELSQHLDNLVHLPTLLHSSLEHDRQIEKVARKYGRAENFLFLGRGMLYPIALEGALKLKEVSYVHAEGYPAGEMKHGPIALIDEETPVVIVLGKDGTNYEKTMSNLKEVESRGARIIAVTDEATPELKDVAWEIIELGPIPRMLLPIVLTVPLQLLAYHVAVYRGTDVDQPRNLAKSVTVE